MKEFMVQITHLDEVKSGKVEDYFTMGQILEVYGQRTQDFKNINEALAATRHLCKKMQRTMDTLRNPNTSTKPSPSSPSSGLSRAMERQLRIFLLPKSSLAKLVS